MAPSAGLIALAAAALAAGAYLFWRRYWFFRSPPRTAPAAEGLLSPADGTVVYARVVAEGEPVVVIKKGVSATVRDIAREDLDHAKVVIGIFMSPFDVHFNRAPISAQVGFIRRHAARGANRFMTAMHWRSLLGIRPLHEGSMHIVENERVVTQFTGTFRGLLTTCYVVQIGARTVNGIDCYVPVGGRVERGAVFGMIRVGSQVDLIVPWHEGLELAVLPGQRVRAGETIVVR